MTDAERILNELILNVGKVTAYADAVAGGYTGTREEWEEALAGIGSEAVAALAAKNAAEAAQTAAETAQSAAETAAGAAGTAASSAADDASGAHIDALAATAAKEAAQTAQGLAEGAKASAIAAKGAAETAQGKAEDAQEAAEAAQTAAETAQAAAETAETNAETAQTGAETAQAAAEAVLESIPEDYSAMSADVTDLKSATSDITGNTLITGWSENHKYIQTSGDTANINSPTTTTSDVHYAVVPCSAGDTFTLTCQGGSGSRAYAFVASDTYSTPYKILMVADAQATLTKQTVTAPEDTAYLVINDITLTGRCYYGILAELRISGVEAGLSSETKRAQNELIYGNAYDILGYYDRINKTQNRVTFTWDASGNHCTVTTDTSASGLAVCNLYYSSGNDLPVGMEPSGTYRLKYTSENVRFQVIAWIEGSESSTTVLESLTDAVFTLPANTVRVTIRLAVASGKTANETVTPKLYTETLTNKELEEMYPIGLESVLPTLDSFRFKWKLGVTIIGTGAESTLATYATSDMVDVKRGNTIINNTPDKGEDEQTTTLRVIAYSNSVFQNRTKIAYGEKYVVPQNIDGVRIIYGYDSTNTDPHEMTRELLDKYFSLKFLNSAEPFGMDSDGEHPVYVAFGASTTSGTVKHKDGADSTLSVYNYPDYVGKVLDLKTYNLGVGGTGFMSRASGNNNFMDQIYNNDDLLSKAGLISIVFGYGNDHYVGPSGAQKLFQIGSYTDYYPYDAEGYHPTGGSAGCVTMVEKGATLMGCLNWCIKWINDHYPYARLVIVFTAPSANKDRAVTMTAQQEDEGVAPYTLTFADPFANPAHNSINEGLKQISTELAKLKAALNIPIIDEYFGGNPISWYSAYAKDPDDSDDYALFSTTGTTEEPEWDSHPNDAGYKYYARAVAGDIIQQFKH